MPDRRSLLWGSSLAFTAAVAGQPSRADASVTRNQTRNVRDFGAKGDGVTDDTEAFNRATQADAEWSWDLLSSIIVPAGRYRISGTVFLRKGQSLIGEGLSTYIDASGAKRSVFIMGHRRDSARGIVDPGGLPVRIERLMGLGGAPDQGFIYAAIPGFQINALFLSAVGLGIEIETADGIISDIEIDQCLTAISLRNSQNIVLTNLNFYLANYGISFLDKCRDIAISNSTFCYTKYATILLGEGGSDITSINVTGCVFTNNIPYDTFYGYIYSRSSNSDLLISNCIFRNSPGYSINQGMGNELSIVVQGCVFDGHRTNPDYNQSLTPKGIQTGHGRFSVVNCAFKNLSEAIRVAPGLTTLEIEGGSIERIEHMPLVVESGSKGEITVRNLRGLAKVEAVAPNYRLVLPWLGAQAHWYVTVNCRDAKAPMQAAQFHIATGQRNMIAHALWNSSTSSTAGQELMVPIETVDTRNGRALHMSLETRHFGDTLPAVDITGYT